MAHFSHVVSAVDFSPATDSQLKYLGKLQELGTTTVTLMHVLDARYGQGPDEDRMQTYKDLLEEKAEVLREQGFTVHTKLGTGAPAEFIVDYARDEQADLILLASRGHNMLKRLLIGSTAAEVLRLTETPVLLDQVEPSDKDGAAERKKARTNGFDRILLATDFSPSARSAEDMAVSLTQEGAEQAVFMTARNTNKNLVTIELARKKLNRLVERAGSHAMSIVRSDGGDPADVITETANEHESTLLIVGKQGRGKLEDRITGSTASTLAKKANRPVLMVPRVSESARQADAKQEDAALNE